VQALLRIFLGVFVSIACHGVAHGQGRPSDPAFNYLTNAPKNGDGRWKGSLGFGMTLSKGNSDSTQASLSADATRTLRDSRMLFRTLLIRATSGHQTNVDNDLGEARYERNFAQASFGFGDITLERDPFRDLQLRQTYSGGTGYRLLQTQDVQLNVYGGAAYTLEDRKIAEDARGWEPLIGNDFNYKISDTASIAQRWVLFPTTVGGGGVRSVFQVDLNTKLSGRFGVQISLLNKYRQHVGAQEKQSDTILFTGITASF
jgi:putative salt-induced outer membrane protein